MNSKEMEIFGAEDYGESDTDSYESDDSQADPHFDLIEETQSRFSNLRIKKKSKSSAVKEMNENVEEEPDVIEAIMPEFDEKDQKSYETVQKVIEDGMINKLKVDQCKVYLRKHGLRLTGNKDTLMQRIKEHLEIINGGGEKKYPASSFVLNCKGDACTGDIVMFEQNVYEMFSIASRSATGPPCGTRLVAGRIVKESYGAAKQQHTFTIEVLWSKGEKPLPPLHPLLIKGRNLYRLKTLRQRWDDEGERQKILSEKHARGSMARWDREARIQEKEMRKMQKSNRVARTEDPNRPKKGRRSSNSIPTNQTEKQQEKKNAATSEPYCRPRTCIPQQQGSLFGKPNNPSTAYVPAERLHQRQPLSVLNYTLPNVNLQCNNLESSMNPIRNANYQQIPTPILVPGAMNSVRIHGHRTQENFNATRNSVLGQGPVRKQTCRFFAQGICWYGDRCKYLHEQSGGK